MKNFSKQIVLALIALAVIAYIGLQLSLNVGDMVNIEHATYATTAESITTGAYFFRDETVMLSNYPGTSTYYFTDGEKVSINEKVVAVYELSSDASVQERINSLNEKIKILERSSVEKSYSTSDISRMDEDINTRVLEIMRSIDNRSLSEAALNKTELLVSLNRRRSIVTAISGFEMQIAAITAQKTQLEASLTGSSAIQTSPASGYFYSTVDGYENIFTKKLIEDMTIEDYDSLSSQTPDTALMANAVGKIVTSSKWYIAISLDKREAIRLTEDKSSSYLYQVTFPFSGNSTLGMTLERKVIQTNSDKAVLIFACSELIKDFNYTRSQTVRIQKNTYSGIKIPVSSLRVVDGVKGVYALDGNVVIFKTADVLYEENGYYICAFPKENNVSYISKEKLSLYDAVIVSGKGIYEGKIIT